MSNCKWQEVYDWAGSKDCGPLKLHNPKETDSGEPHWPFGETWDTWSRGKSRWLPINITKESTVQHLHSYKPQPKIVDLKILLQQTNNNNNNNN